MNHNMGTRWVAITKRRHVETAKLQCDSKHFEEQSFAKNPSVDGHCDLSVGQIGFNGWPIFCFFLFVSALNAVRCTTRPQTVQRSANGWPNAQMIQRRPTTSARTLKMYERHEQSTHCYLCPELCVAVEIQSWIHSVHNKIPLELSPHLCHGGGVVSFLSQTTTSLQICDGSAGM